MKPQSYPFMNIAKKHGLDYGDVLMVADYWRKGSRIIDQDDRTLPALHNALEWPHEALGEITFANADFRRIQHGHIDWNTGEPIPLPRWIDIDPEPGEHAEIIHALDYRNHDEE